MQTIQNITKTAGVISYWLEGEAAFTVTRNANGFPISVQAHQGLWQSQKCLLNYDVDGNLIGISGHIDTKMLPKIIAEATSAATIGKDVNGNTELRGVNGVTIPGLSVTGAVAATTTIKSGGYTVATLPAGTIGMRAYVTDATTPTWNAALVGGGTVKVPVFHNGTAWVSA